MPRPKADLPAPDALRALIDSDGRLAIRATPGARSEAVTIDGDRVAVKVRAKPQDGAANVAITHLMARALGLAPSRVELSHGATSREKVLRIEL